MTKSQLFYLNNCDIFCLRFDVRLLLYKINMSLVLYVKSGCPYCQQARDYYNKNKIPFIEYDAQNDKKRQNEMLEFSGSDLTVPCIVENGEYIQSGWGNPLRG